MSFCLSPINAAIKAVSNPTNKIPFKVVGANENKKLELVKKIQKASFIKHKDWSYEEEYRLINTKRNLIRFPGKITGVYFGMNMSSIDKRMIGIILDPNFSNGIKFYQMYRPLNFYSLKYRQFDIKGDLPGFGDALKLE